MGKKKCPECPTCMPEWLAAFGDLMSLLLCFFVLLLSMSSMDAKKVSEAIGSLAGAMSVLEGGMQTEVSKKLQQSATPMEAVEETAEEVNRVAQAIKEMNEIGEVTAQGGGPSVSLEEAQEGFVIELPASLLFKSGSTTIQNDDMLLFLKRIALVIGELPNDVLVSVRGHTDDQGPGVKSPYKDNWELSAARAIAVLQELVLDGVSPKRISAAGYAEFSPKATNTTESGREQNRRVEIHFFGGSLSNKSKTEQTVLDKAASK